MSQPSYNQSFLNSSSQDQYGKKPLQSWVGKVVSYESQKDQIDGGWGWRYKVRILGDNSNDQTTSDGELSYAMCLLPTTAGSGAAYKLRSVRVSQGDMVYGIYGGNGPRMILGVFPRTQYTESTSGNFGTLSGFYGSLQKNKTLSGEFNDQIGPATPGVTPLDPKTYNKSNRDDSSDKLEQLGYDRNQDGEIDDAEAKLTPTRTAGTKVWNKDENDGAIVTSQLENILQNPYEESPIYDPDLKRDLDPFDDGKMDLRDPNKVNYENYAIDAVNQALTQDLISETVAKDMIRQIRKGNIDKALEIGFPPTE